MQIGLHLKTGDDLQARDEPKSPETAFKVLLSSNVGCSSGESGKGGEQGTLPARYYHQNTRLASQAAVDRLTLPRRRRKATSCPGRINKLRIFCRGKLSISTLTASRALTRPRKRCVAKDTFAETSLATILLHADVRGEKTLLSDATELNTTCQQLS